jgi:hypothetical protein
LCARLGSNQGPKDHDSSTLTVSIFAKYYSWFKTFDKTAPSVVALAFATCTQLKLNSGLLNNWEINKLEF